MPHKVTKQMADKKDDYHHEEPTTARDSIHHHAHVPEMKKPRVAIHSITGCAGCQLTIYFIKDILLDLFGAIDLVSAPMVKSKNEDGPYDVCFIEGSVSSEGDLEHLKKWREQSTVLVALGTCATHANVQGMVHYQDMTAAKERVYQQKEPLNLKGKLKPIVSSPIKDHVKVDFEISGCPPDETEILRFVKQFLIGMSPRIYNECVCVECTLRQTKCLLEDGDFCMGPLIRGGCNAICPAMGHPCTGCRGPTHECNVPQTVKLLVENGVSEKKVRSMFKKYAGYEFEEIGAHLQDESKPLAHIPHIPSPRDKKKVS